MLDTFQSAHPYGVRLFSQKGLPLFQVFQFTHSFRVRLFQDWIVDYNSAFILIRADGISPNAAT